MNTFAIAMVKDEADVIEATIRRMMTQVDHVIVADNGSTDDTREILESLPITLLDDPEPGYYQSQKMSKLAAMAASFGAEWVVPFDADEVWRTTTGERIAEVLAGVTKAVAVAQMFDHYCTAKDPEGDPITRMGWRSREPLGLAKVACRTSLPVTIAQGNHGAHYPSGHVEGLLEIRHFPYRSEEQFVSKARNGAAAYAATDLPQDVGQHWREYGAHIDKGGEQAGREWFRDAFFYEKPEDSLIYDPCS